MGGYLQVIGQSRCLHACSDVQLGFRVQPLEIAPVALRVIVLVCLVYGRVRWLIPVIPLCSSMGYRATRVLLPLPETKHAWPLVLENFMHVSHPITRGVRGYRDQFALMKIIQGLILCLRQMKVLSWSTRFTFTLYW